MGWIILSAFGTVLATAVLWGFLGSVAHDVPCSGMLVKSGGVFEVSALSNGRITDLAVRVGDMVTEGQVVARMSQPELADKLLEARAVVTELKTRHAGRSWPTGPDVARRPGFSRSGRPSPRPSPQPARKSPRRDGRAQAKLVREGLLAGPDQLATRRRSAGGQRIGDGQSQLAQIAVPAGAARAPRRVSQPYQIAAQGARHRGAGPRGSRTEVVSPHTGRILEIIADQGTLVAAGDAIVTLDLTGRTVKGWRWSSTCRRATASNRVGMTAYVSPSTVKREGSA
jgi:HlyD family secretion protein